jgi:23S rRNA-/tRNA-specific pseudouridylate synthase
MTSSRPDAKVLYVTCLETTTLLTTCQANLKGFNAKTVIESGGVWCNQKRLTDPNIEVKAGQTLKVYTCPTQGYRYLFAKQLIIKETDDWVVVLKEPLITVAMDRSNQYFNLMAGLNDYYGFSDFTQGVQPITRLDYRVGGVCLFSKHKAAERMLFKQMQQRRIKKRYMCAVHRRGQDVGAGKKIVKVKNKLSQKFKAYQDPVHGKQAETWFVPVSEGVQQEYGKGGACALYYALTKTGRRHQVRCHAAGSVGGLVNDDVYVTRLKDRHRPIGLLAYAIKFKWKGEQVCITVPDSWVRYWLDSLS